jgi:hypothetical protein
MLSIVTGVMDTPVERVRGRARGGGWNFRVPGLPGESHGGHPLGGRNDLMVTVAPRSGKTLLR